MLLRHALRPLARRRWYSTKFQQPNSAEVTALLAQYGTAAPRPLNLSQLLSFGRPVTPDSVLSSVSYVLYELPRRLATRVRYLESLPFIVGTNPYVAKTLKAFREGFWVLATHPPVTNLEENEKFQESAKYMSFEDINAFLDGAIRNRISVRLIAEQHIAVTRALHDPPQDGKDVGVIDTRCSPKEMVDVCGSFVGDLCRATLGSAPEIVVDGYPEATFAYIPVHLEYVLTELLKNSFRATVEHHARSKERGSLPPIQITLSPPPASSHSGHNVDRPNFFSIRIRDQGGGVSRQHLERIFSYAFTTVKTGDDEGPDWDTSDSREDEPFLGVMTQRTLQTGLGTIAGLGYGLPMSKLYTKYFGGSLDLISLEGWGSDVYIKLRCLDEAGDSNI
ncbi:atypical/PDHK/BCKDK protein kinase [Coprinopsis cinerea okayama7|uniref:Protein-serine/threonine kinase n=1 Tax=Coprinopsis cinerea (strain Okayama-7 / 130 / ATCC MYA-4618 / FGSC 9003) TaxID=240176 RepID=D6RKY6_COPC7|nr:atypical/PDHK/BCKDK protein kinase [Coprinopsis cinerea okayama7\|eukprot:XP_002911916.1 atypical/PDHK/BCKDK protein kinase [Coprinopsis cinerea okayama7\